MSSDKIEIDESLERYLATSGQHAMWIAEEMAPSPGLYFVRNLVVFQSKFEIGDIQTAIQVLSLELDVLRTTFEHNGVKLYGNISEEPNVSIEYVEVAKGTDDAIAKLIVHAAKSHRRRSGKLAFFDVIHTEDEKTLILTSIHHCLVDGNSVDKLIGRLTELLRKDRQTSRLTNNFRDYANWKNESSQAAFEKSKGYWIDRFSTLAPSQIESLPLSSMCTSEVISIEKEISFDKYERVLNFCQRENITPFALFMSSYGAMLNSAGFSDAYIGVPIFSAAATKFNDVVGPTTSMQGVILQHISQDTIQSVIESCIDQILTAYEYPELDDGEIGSLLNKNRIENCATQYNALFVMQSDFQRSEPDDTFWEIRPVPSRSAKAPISLSLTRSANKRVAIFEFDSNKFRSVEAEILASRFLEVVDTISRGSKLILVQDLTSEFEDMVELERICINSTEKFDDWNIPAAFDAVSSKFPAKQALVDASGSITYEQLRLIVDAICHELRLLGVVRGSYVGLSMPKSINTIATIFALLKCGAIVVPIDSSYPERRCRTIIGDADIKVVIGDYDAVKLRGMCKEFILLDDLRAAAENQLENGSVLKVDLHSTDGAFGVFTSGSSGTPKGVEINHAGIKRLVDEAAKFHQGHNERFLIHSSLSWDACLFEIFGSLLNGSLGVICTDNLPCLEGLANQVLKDEITILFLTAGYFQNLTPTEFSKMESLRTLVTGGDRGTISAFDAFSTALPTCVLVNGYGPTEATTFATFCHVNGQRKQTKAVPIGRPISGTEAYVMGTDGQFLPKGMTGEIWLGGQSLANGYIGRVDETNKSFVFSKSCHSHSNATQRYYKTGDIGRWSDDGQLIFLGRKDDQVKIRGFRVEIGEIDTVLASESWLASYHLATLGEGIEKQLVLYLIGSYPESAEDRVRVALTKQLPEFMVPSFIVRVDSVALNRNGKVDRSLLPDPQSLVASIGDTPHFDTQSEGKLLDIWRDVLDAQQIGPTDDFFRFGGDSIRAMQIVARGRELGLKLQPSMINTHRNVREICRHLQPLSTTKGAIGLGSVGSKSPLTPIQRILMRQNGNNIDGFCMSKVFEVSTDISFTTVVAALNELIHSNPILSSRIDISGIGGCESSEFSQVIAKKMEVRNLDTQSALIKKGAEDLRNAINIDSGDLVKSLYIDVENTGSNYLLIMIHHFVVDIISWNNIEQHLRRVFDQYSEGIAKPRTGSTSSSYFDWIQSLDSYSRTTKNKIERGELAKLIPLQIEPIPKDINISAHQAKYGASEVHTLEIPNFAPNHLALQIEQNFEPNIKDILVAGLVMTIQEWTQKDSVQLAFESHGRANIDNMMDFSDSIGWFTSIYPLEFELPQSSEPKQFLRYVHRLMERVPKLGISFSASSEAFQIENLPEISFNYFGKVIDDISKVQNSKALPKSIQMTDIHFESDRCGELTRLFLIDLNVTLLGDKLVANWVYDTNSHFDSTLAYLSSTFEKNIDRILKSFSVETMNSPPVYQEITKCSKQSPDIERFPTVGAQSAMIMENAMHSEDGRYIVQWRADLRGDFDHDVFINGLEKVVEGSCALRSAFEIGDGSTVHQYFDSETHVRNAYFDLSDQSNESIVAHIEEYLIADRIESFDLSKPPLIRACTIRSMEDEWCIILTYHHALMDGWSFSNFLTDLDAAYLIGIKGQTDSGIRRPQYTDYLNYVGERDLEGSQKFWSLQLSDFGQASKFPFELSGSCEQKEEIVRHRLEIEDQVFAKLESFATQAELSLNTVFLATWLQVVAKYSGTRAICIGVTESGRPAELVGSADQIGLFVNTVPICSNVPASCSLDWIRSIQDAQWLSRDHVHCTVTEIKNWANIHPSTEVFRYLFVYESYPDTLASDQSILNCSVKNSGAIERTGYPLNVVIKPGGTFAIEFDYRASAFSEKAINSLASHYLSALACLSESLGSKGNLMQFSVPSEQKKLVERFAPVSSVAPKQETILTIFERQALAHPDKIAVSYGEDSFSYDTLNQCANALAQKLIEDGISIGDHIAICTTRCCEMIVGILAILKAGAAYVPISHKNPQERLSSLLERANCANILTQKSLDGLFSESSAKRYYLEDWKDSPDDRISNLNLQIDPTSTCYIYFTSGTTGIPKGVVVEHLSLTNLYVGYNAEYRLEENDHHVLQMSHMSFDVFTADLVRALCSGGRLVLCPQEFLMESDNLAKLITDEKITYAEFVPVVLRGLIEHLETSQEKLVDVRIIVAGADAWYGSDYNRIKDLTGSDTRIINAYGVTECTVDSCVFETKERLDAAAMVPIARPFINEKLYVLDDREQVCPLNVSGELFIGGLGVAREYLGDPTLTGQKFREIEILGQTERVYATGDGAYYADDDTIRLIGRLDSQVKIRGMRIEIGEVEEAMRRIKSVKDAVACVWPGSKPDEKTFVGYYSAKEELTTNFIRGEMRMMVPWFLVPDYFCFVPKFPTNINGKISRADLPVFGYQDVSKGQAFEPPKNDLERELSSIWCRCLGISKIGMNDDFWELGGNSLTAMNISTQLRSQYSKKIGVRDVLRFTTVREFINNTEIANISSKWHGGDRK